MSLSDLITADAADVVLNTDDFGETVTHYPLGDTEGGEDVTAVWVEEDAAEDRGRGQEVVRKATVLVASSVTVTVKDTWLRGGLLWSTETVGPGDYGLSECGVKLHQVQRQRRPAGM